MAEETKTRLRVLIVDDSEVVRTKLRGLLEADRGFELVGEADDGETGLEVAREQQPDLVVMDLRMPGMSGIQATWQLGTVAPSSKVLVLTVSADQEDVTDAIMAGARGYVVKGARDEEITAALRGVAAGERVISPQVASKLAERVASEWDEHRGSKPTTPSAAAPAAPRVPTPKAPPRAEPAPSAEAVPSAEAAPPAAEARRAMIWAVVIAFAAGVALTLLATRLFG
ncbi:MAG: response regulator transcription factor [Solirubrobacterales bacterium]